MSDPFSSTTQALGVPELVLEVMSYLDQVSLYQAALVCRDWSSKAQLELYRAPELVKELITEPERVTRTRLLVRTVTAVPALAEMVKQLGFFNSLIESDSIEDQDEEVRLQTRLLWLCPKLDTLTVEGKLTAPPA